MSAAASTIERFKNWLNAVDEGDEIENTTGAPHSSGQDPFTAPPRRNQRGSHLTLQRPAEGGMEIRHPASLADREGIGLDLKQGRMVTLDLTRLKDGEAKYFLEFVYGVVFALNATAEQVNEGIYLLAPRGISVRNDAEDLPVRPNASATRSSSFGRGEQEEVWLAR